MSLRNGFFSTNTENNFMSDLTGSYIPDSFYLGNYQNELQFQKESQTANTETRNLFGSYYGNGGNIMSYDGFQQNSQVSSSAFNFDASRPGSSDENGSITQQAEGFGGVAEETGSISGYASLGTMFAGSVASQANNAIMHGLSNEITTETKEGIGVSQHGVLQDVTAQMQQNTMDTYSGLAATAIAAGSLFGPEGLAVGAVAGAAIDAAGYIQSSQEDALVQTTSGEMTQA